MRTEQELRKMIADMELIVITAMQIEVCSQHTNEVMVAVIGALNWVLRVRDDITPWIEETTSTAEQLRRVDAAASN